MSKHKQTLVLNADFTPFSVISWKRAMKQTMLNQSVPELGYLIVEYYKDDFVLNSKGVEYPVPCIVRMQKYVNRKKEKLSFTRKNVFIRDRMTCQYCGKTFNQENLTFDHVIPKSKWRSLGNKGTPTKWTNIVTACKPCNTHKGNSILEKSGMRLIKDPIRPDAMKYVSGFSPYQKNIPKEWIPYLKISYGDIL